MSMFDIDEILRRLRERKEFIKNNTRNKGYYRAGFDPFDTEPQPTWTNPKRRRRAPGKSYGGGGGCRDKAEELFNRLYPSFARRPWLPRLVEQRMGMLAGNAIGPQGAYGYIQFTYTYTVKENGRWISHTVKSPKVEISKWKDALRFYELESQFLNNELNIAEMFLLAIVMDEYIEYEELD